MNNNHIGRTRLRDVMLRRYLRLGEFHTLHEVMGFITDKHFETEGVPFLVVIDTEGNFAGILETKAILAALMEGVQQGPGAEVSLRDCAEVNLSKTVGHIMNRNITQLSPDAFLQEAISSIHKSSTEAIAITEDGRIVGLVTARILFEQASALTVGALTGGVIPDSGN